MFGATRPSLMHAELHDHLRAAGFRVGPGDLGENITTRGVDLLGLSTATRLHLGDDAVVEVTGLRNPCTQIDEYRRRLLKEVVGRDETGAVVYKAGVMGVVLTGATSAQETRSGSFGLLTRIVRSSGSEIVDDDRARSSS
ncbi:MAG TPA: MOSC domain-containing protein [Jiangellaceae bacterium]|nr:MOSC domain-containing protein [Jiangellaceae bacterium]